jgi:hypothetical protein
MIRLAAVVVLAVELGGGFSTATATVVSTTEQSMIIELHVGVEVEATSVVAHFALPGEEQITIPLLFRSGEDYGVTTELRPANYQVVFEAIGEQSVLSEPASLTDLGADLESAGISVDGEEDEGFSAGTQSWLWLGVALGAASLSALAFWVLGGGKKDDDPKADEQSEPDRKKDDDPTADEQSEPDGEPDPAPTVDTSG